VNKLFIALILIGFITTDALYAKPAADSVKLSEITRDAIIYGASDSKLLEIAVAIDNYILSPNIDENEKEALKIIQEKLINYFLVKRALVSSKTTSSGSQRLIINALRSAFIDSDEPELKLRKDFSKLSIDELISPTFLLESKIYGGNPKKKDGTPLRVNLNHVGTPGLWKQFWRLFNGKKPEIDDEEVTKIGSLYDLEANLWLKSTKNSLKTLLFYRNIYPSALRNNISVTEMSNLVCSIGKDDKSLCTKDVLFELNKTAINYKHNDLKDLKSYSSQEVADGLCSGIRKIVLSSPKYEEMGCNSLWYRTLGRVNDNGVELRDTKFRTSVKNDLEFELNYDYVVTDRDHVATNFDNELRNKTCAEYSSLLATVKSNGIGLLLLTNSLQGLDCNIYSDKNKEAMTTNEIKTINNNNIKLVGSAIQESVNIVLANIEKTNKSFKDSFANAKKGKPYKDDENTQNFLVGNIKNLMSLNPVATAQALVSYPGYLPHIVLPLFEQIDSSREQQEIIDDIVHAGTYIVGGACAIFAVVAPYVGISMLTTYAGALGTTSTVLFVAGTSYAGVRTYLEYDTYSNVRKVIQSQNGDNLSLSEMQAAYGKAIDFAYETAINSGLITLMSAINLAAKNSSAVKPTSELGTYDDVYNVTKNVAKVEKTPYSLTEEFREDVDLIYEDWTPDGFPTVVVSTMDKTVTNMSVKLESFMKSLPKGSKLYSDVVMSSSGENVFRISVAVKSIQELDTLLKKIKVAYPELEVEKKTDNGLTAPKKAKVTKFVGGAVYYQDDIYPDKWRREGDPYKSLYTFKETSQGNSILTVDGVSYKGLLKSGAPSLVKLYWWDTYQKYKAFKEINRRDPNTTSDDKDERILATWLSVQRVAYYQKAISKEKRLLLEFVPGHVWNSKDAEWEEMYQAYKEFREKYGRDPSRSLSVAMNSFELKIASWLGTQRLAYNKNPKEISQKRIEKLNLVPGHIWQVLLMSTNKQEKSSSDVLETTSDDGMALGNGLTAPRSAKITKVVGGLVFYQDDISPDKWKRDGDPYNTLYTFEETPQGSAILTVNGLSYEDLLKSGTSFLVEGAWWGTYQKYKVFKEKMKRDPGSMSDDKDEVALFGWLRSQRKEYKYQRINKVKRLLLEFVPGHVWNLNDAEWEEMYQAYKEFKEKYGRDPSQSLSVAMNSFELKIAYWLMNQRRFYNKDPKEISQERIDKLNLVPGHVWEVRFMSTNKQEKNKNDLKEGSSDITDTDSGSTQPQKAKVIKLVGGLVFYQDDISPDKWKRDGDPYNTLYTFEETSQGSAILTVDGFSYEDLLKAGASFLVKGAWWDTYQKYKAFKEKMKRDPGSMSDDKDEVVLFDWLKTQRNEYKHKRINKGKRLLLEFVPGHVWNLKDVEWEEVYQAYKEFKEKYGRDPSRSLSVAMDVLELKIARWLGTQRSAYNKDPKEISQERIDKLNLVPGHVWEVQLMSTNKQEKNKKTLKESSSDILETTSDGEMGTENGLTAPKSAKITKVVGGLVFYQDDIYPDKWKREGDPYNALYTFEETPQGSSILTINGVSYEDLLKAGTSSLVKVSWWN